jgi:hypothetical protein
MTQINKRFLRAFLQKALLSSPAASVPGSTL